MSARAFLRAPRDFARLLLVAAAAIGVPVFFAYSSEVAGAIGSALRLKVEPAISGGRALAEFADPLGDDVGYGKLEYPMGPGWERGELDLTHYTVRAPVTRPAWGGGGAYWQLEATSRRRSPAACPAAASALPSSTRTSGSKARRRARLRPPSGTENWSASIPAIPGITSSRPTAGRRAPRSDRRTVRTAPRSSRRGTRDGAA